MRLAKALTTKIPTPGLLLGAIIAIYLTWSVIYAALIPPWESPDEPSHYLYVAYLAQHGVPPGPSPVRPSGRFYTGGYITSMYQWYHPALGYAPHALAYRIWSTFNAAGLPRTFPPVNPALILNSFTHGYLFLPEAPLPLGWLQLYPGLLALRLTSSLLGALTIVCIWNIATSIRPGESAFAATVAATVALIPQFIFINATVRNDCLQNLIAAAALWIMVRLVVRSDPLSRQAILLLGLLNAAALLTKYTLLFVIPLSAIALAITSPYPRTWPAMASWLIAPIVISMSLYYIAFPQASQAIIFFGQTEVPITPSLLNWKTMTEGLPLLRDLFWARFGWANVSVPPLWTRILTVLSFSGIGLSWVTTIRHKCAGRLSVSTWQQLVILTLAVGLVALGFVRYNIHIFQPQGRFLFPALGPLAILALYGAWQPSPKWMRGLLTISIVTGLTTFNLIAITRSIYPAYYQARLPTAFQIQATEPVGEIYGKTTYGQTFVALYPNLYRIDVMMATYARENHLPVVFHLRRGLPEEAKQDIVTLKVQPSDIADDAYHSFVFPSIPDSQEQTFYFYLASPRSMPGDAFTIWSTPEDAYPAGTRTVNGQPAPGDLCFIAYSDLGAKP